MDPFSEALGWLSEPAEPQSESERAIALREMLAALPSGVSRATAVRLWRAAEAERDPPRPLIVWGGTAVGRTVDFARLRYGHAAPLAMATQPADALAAAARGDVAVLALEGAWWGRLLALPALKVSAALPCLGSLGEICALAVTAGEPEPTGADLTFWVSDAAEAAGKVVAAMSRDGVAAEPLASAGGLKLFALAGFYQVGDPRLARAPGRLSGVIGAAPAPLAV